MSHPNWEAVIGLEIHVQLATESKLFTTAANRYGDPPNRNVDSVVLGFPGVLPVLNKKAVELAMRVGFALNCEVHQRSRFDRKHYFYADLPKGYQITQHLHPICTGGAVQVTIDGLERSFRLNRIHLEEDAGKTIHDSRRGISLVDYNRAGVPLIEVVSEPDMRTAEEAVAFMKALHQVVVATGSSLGDMEKGHFRCDANVSVRPVGQEKLGTRTEMKNINPTKFLCNNMSMGKQSSASLGGTLNKNNTCRIMKKTICNSKPSCRSSSYWWLCPLFRLSRTVK